MREQLDTYRAPAPIMATVMGRSGKLPSGGGGEGTYGLISRVLGRLREPKLVNLLNIAVTVWRARRERDVGN